MDANILWPPNGREIEHWGFVLGLVLGRDPGYPMKRPFLLGIRGVMPHESATHATTCAPVYDDSFVLYRADGLVPPTLFRGATHAFQKKSGASPDVDGDGLGDVATIDPGPYVMRLVPDKYPVFSIATPGGGARVFCHRDLDHDGVPEAGGYLATDILFHCGYDAPADSTHKSSIGCQTASLEWMRALADAARGYDAVDYQLVTAESLIAVLKSASVEGFPLPNPESVA